MRKVLISLAAAGSALAFATPAAAQYYPQAQPYGQPYGYGYNNNYGQVRALQARINQVQRQIERLDRRDRSASAPPTACAMRPTASSTGFAGSAATG